MHFSFAELTLQHALHRAHFRNMPQCYVKNCGNYYGKTRGDNSVKYHMFPNINSEMGKKWNELCTGKKNAKLPAHARVCSIHFTEDSYLRDLQHELLGLPVRKKLKPDAEPSLHLPQNREGSFNKLESRENNCDKTTNDEENYKFPETKNAADNKVAHKNVIVNKLPLRQINEKSPTRRISNSKIPMRSSIRIAKKRSLECDSIVINVKNRKKNKSDGELIINKIRFMNALNLKYERNRTHHNNNEDIVCWVKRIQQKDSLNKMHVMEDVREGCDTQPASPGHADQRPGLDSDQCHDNESTSENNDNITSSVTDESVVKIENELQQNGKSSLENEKDEAVDQHINQMKEPDIDGVVEDSGSNDSSSVKRRNEQIEPSQKKFKSSIDESFHMRDKVINAYLDNIYCNSLEEIQAISEQTLSEIRTLNDLAKEKEREWNNIIHLKKLKEEILLRIQRKKQIMLLSTNRLETEANNFNQGDVRAHNNAGNMQSLLKPKGSYNLKNRNIFPKSSQCNAYDMNGHPNDYKQKQRNVVDVQSIIADYRQRHPETVPRRGRRIRTNANNQTDKVSSSGILNFSSLALGSGAQVRQGPQNNNGIDNNSDLGILLNSMENGSRQDVLRSQLSEMGSSNSQDITSFKDMLVQFAKLSQTERQELMQNKTTPPPPYPEVTVHPVTSTSPQHPNSSLLHGILTKAQTKPESKATFSPTLARLLTAPERAAASQTNSTPTFVHGGNVSITEILSSNKARNEITITPVSGGYETSTKGKSNMEEEEAEDSADRLVIDEGMELIDGRSKIDNSDSDEVPQCQGCNQKSAQFVCAGCGNQWYCSRDCQVTAWDEHSEVCSG